MTETTASQAKAVTTPTKTQATKTQASAMTVGNCKTLSEKVRSSAACLMRRSKHLLASIPKKSLRRTRLQAAKEVIRKTSLIGNKQALVAVGKGTGAAVGGTGAAEAVVGVAEAGTGAGVGIAEAGVGVFVGETGLEVEVAEAATLGLILIDPSRGRRKNSFNCKNKIIVMVKA
jgi:hypothetical protein